MLRLVELALFLAPFAVFVAWRFLALEGGPPVRVVIGAACVLAVPPGVGYEPPRLQDGKVISAHGAPR